MPTKGCVDAERGNSGGLHAVSLGQAAHFPHYVCAPLPFQSV